MAPGILNLSAKCGSSCAAHVVGPATSALETHVNRALQAVGVGEFRKFSSLVASRVRVGKLKAL